MTTRGVAGSLHDKTASMTTLRTSSATSWTLLAVAVTALATAACKKQPDTQTPDDAGGGEVSKPAEEPEDDAAPEVLTVDVFEETVQGKTGDVTDCLAKAREAKPDLAGKLVYDFTIAGDGKVSEVKPDPASTLKDEGMNACVIEKAKTWQFPKTRDGESMTLPYTFSMG